MKTLLALLLLIPSLSWGNDKEIFDKGWKDIQSKRFETGISLLKQLASNDMCSDYCVEAKYIIGLMYDEGIPGHIDKNKTLAYEYFNEASVSGQKHAHIQISRYIHNGWDDGQKTSSDKVLALAYLKLAVMAGLNDYKTNITQYTLNNNLSTSEVDKSEAFAKSFYSCIYLNECPYD